jgi:hypothetical protein
MLQPRYPIQAADYFPAGCHNGKGFSDLNVPATSVRPGRWAGSTQKHQNKIKHMNTITKTRRSFAVLLTSILTAAAAGIAAAQGIDVGNGNPPPDTIEFKAASLRKATQMQELTPGFEARNRTEITLRARVYYRDKNGRMQPLGYRSVPVTFSVGQGVLKTANTDQSGWATIRCQVYSTRPIGANGMPVGWTARFAGDTELNRCHANGRFLLKR